MKLLERIKYFFSDKAIEEKVHKALDDKIESYVINEFIKREIAIDISLNNLLDAENYIKGILQATITETLINILNNVMQGNTQNTGESPHNWINFEEGYYWKVKDSVLEDMKKYEQSNNHVDLAMYYELQRMLYSYGPNSTNHEKVYYSVDKNIFDSRMQEMLKNLMNDDIIKALSKVDGKVNSEGFITEIVKRINNKQLKG